MTVDEYLARVPADARGTFDDLRRIVKAAAPKAEETISYGMLAYKQHGRNVAYIAAWKSHCALYGMDMNIHKDDLAAYDTAKGTIRFQAGQSLPEDLIRTMVAERAAEAG